MRALEFRNSFDYPGQALHDEIGLYVKYGLTPAQALQSAVIAATRKIRMVLSRGTPCGRAALDKMLADVKAWVAAQP